MVKRVYNRPDGPQCKICLRRFSSNTKLRNHKDRVHNENRVDRFECDTCHRRFGKKSNMMQHIRTVHLKERRFFCGDCGQAFGESGHRNAHVRMMHDNIRSAACFHCGKTFCSDGALMHHTRRVHYKEKYAHPRPCSECAYVADRPSKLRAHYYARHTKIRCPLRIRLHEVVLGRQQPRPMPPQEAVEEGRPQYLPTLQVVRDSQDRRQRAAAGQRDAAGRVHDMRFQDNSQLKFHILHVHL